MVPDTYGTKALVKGKVYEMLPIAYIYFNESPQLPEMMFKHVNALYMQMFSDCNSQQLS